MWSPSTAEAYVVAALDLAEEALPLLGVIDADTAFGDALNRRVKFLMETGLLLQAVHRTPRLSEATRGRARAIGSLLAPYARHDKLRAALVLRPSVAAEYAVAHGCLTAIGLPDDSFQRAVAHALAADEAASFQRLPWKELELAWAEDLLGAPRSSNVAAALPLTFLSRGLDLLGASRMEMYHFTHELIYLTDFGHRRQQPPRPAAVLEQEASSAVARTLDDDDFDLCAELLLTWPYLQLPWNGVASYALASLLRVAGELGVLPSMTFDATTAAGQADDAARRAYFLKESYHGQYVWAFLMLATLLPGASPSWGAGRPSRRVPALPMARQGHPALWTVLRPATGDAAVLSFDVALTRAYAARDFALLGRLLATDDRPQTRLAEQVEDTLVRVALASA